MCGICGEVRISGQPALAALGRVNDAMQARGPDAAGLYVQGGIALGHRRLSILDLSAAAQQPMIDAALGLGIVFNGCIYNFRELRAELQAKGYRFFSDGDTEVILKAYHAWGKTCVQRFKGMFAFALWERDSGRVVIARDRLGIKPLYYTEGPGFLRFASSLPALLAGGDVDTSIDRTALHHFFSFHAAVPAPRTILNGVKKLEPATLLTIEPDGTQRRERYWQFSVGASRSTDRAMSQEEWSDALLDAMTSAVDRRRVADVPVGVLLSGGLDSSLLVALLSKLGHEDIRTFSIGFDAVGKHAGDEFHYSDIIARTFGTNHEQIRIGGTCALDALPHAIAAMSEPMVSHDAVAFYLLSSEVAKRVKVVQSGQGADEVFGGYSWYPGFLSANDPVQQYQNAYFDWTHSDLQRLLAPELLGEDDESLAFVERFFAAHAGASAVDKVLQIDTEIMLVDDPVKRVDNMTMAFGLEARVPFLDHDVVELAARMPAELKVKNGGKHILKEAARRCVPAEVIDRPKGYFPVPSLRYLRGPFLDYVRDVLNDEKARARGLYQRDFIDHMLQNPETEMSPKGHSRLWQAALLEAWLQTHGI
ncbi:MULTISPECIES: N-acetylglutaminylglutamine amidotransferase [unclassified Bradyrhizobium]|uniref:N-acetylglutaminylglutamine amidotransferase n=1 Tax=unclassified Bradyrhizobium TaxID=2631580 RepID=UPI0029163392|nr:MULTISPECIES: N-acetylglutaminylglutamine amidotransferase [unclassified Bradyrhizobium]